MPALALDQVVPDRKPISLGQERKSLPGQMTAEDRFLLNREVQKELKGYKEQLDRTTSEKKSLMMDPKLMELKAEIHKKVVYYKKKHRDLPEFVRVKKAQIIQDREENERKE
jgi:hypothetical protein